MTHSTTSLAGDLPLVSPDTCLGLHDCGHPNGISQYQGCLPTEAPPSLEPIGRPSVLVHITATTHAANVNRRIFMQGKEKRTKFHLS
ncbi:hypothetical protein PAMP_013194 [Pampus punctatissimus]